MPANIGKMFYFGDVPWHGEGTKVAAPLNVGEALKAGGLDWEVGKIALQTQEIPPSPCKRRQAIVRLDRHAGDNGRVLGIAYRGFQPLQNGEGAQLFDRLLGRGKAHYHTGGYLGDGEVIWLMAKIDRLLTVASGDTVEPYALFVNSHDGSRAVSICLTTVRVVCQNTLNMALNEKEIAPQLRRAHQGTVQEHEKAAQGFWKSIGTQLDRTQALFGELATTPCSAEQFRELLDDLFPLPEPNGTKQRERRIEEVQQVRQTVSRLRKEGKGADSAPGSLWGVLNAVTEFVDHYKYGGVAPVGQTLLGPGMTLKRKAYARIIDLTNLAV